MPENQPTPPRNWHRLYPDAINPDGTWRSDMGKICQCLVHSEVKLDVGEDCPKCQLLNAANDI